MSSRMVVPDIDDELLLSDEEALLESQLAERRRKQRTLAAAGALAALALVGAAAATSFGGLVSQKGGVQSSFQMSRHSLEVSAEVHCSAGGENCSSTKCCSGPGMQCFVKDIHWAECRATCVPGPDPRSPDSNPWTCDKLGERAAGEVPACSKMGEDCGKSQCCEASGMQCYEKSDGYATCKADCLKGVNLMDQDSTPWTCAALGSRTPDVAPWVWSECAATNADCTKSQCCNTPGKQCFMKDQYYGTCMDKCDPNALATQGWSCDARGQRLPDPAPKPSPAEGKPADWVADYCAKDGEDCRKSTCCAEPGFQCFEKNSSYARCKGTCQEGPDLYDADNRPWSCKELGPFTPGAVALEPWEARKEVSKWVATTCAKQFADNCAETKCCRKVGDQCYQKNEGWAACSPNCVPGVREGDDTGGNWTCEELGPRTHRPYPSLYCFSVLQPFGYEPGLMKAQIPTGHGIWACDRFSAFSVKEIEIGEMNGKSIKTVTFVPAKVGQSKDHTAANAELFMHVWDAVGKLGLWKLTDWTVKVDPDAVLLPTRLRKHLDQFTGQHGYVVNCAKPFMPEGPMMFGALEAFTHSALETYYTKAKDCASGLPWPIWGEDLYMGKCMEKLGADRLNDFTIYSDGVCRGVDCADPDAAAFHPKKDVASWMACLEQTNNPHPKVVTEAPQWFKDYMSVYTR